MSMTHRVLVKPVRRLSNSECACVSIRAFWYNELNDVRLPDGDEAAPGSILDSSLIAQRSGHSCAEQILVDQPIPSDRKTMQGAIPSTHIA